jgi:hypothetical protein
MSIHHEWSNVPQLDGARNGAMHTINPDSPPEAEETVERLLVNHDGELDGMLLRGAPRIARALWLRSVRLSNTCTRFGGPPGSDRARSALT